MIIIKFIRWWWSILDYHQRTAISICAGIITGLIGLMIFGAKFLLFALLGLLVGIVIWGSTIIVRGIRLQWLYFKELQKQEEEEVIRRLKGTR